MNARDFIEKHWSRGCLCHLCGTEVSRKDASRDHVVPKSKGGTDAEANSAIAHKHCNNKRGNLDLADKPKRLWNGKTGRMYA